MDFTELDKDLPEGNMGGIPQYFYFGLHKDVATWPTLPAAPATLEENATLTGNVTMKTGKRMFTMYVTDDMGELTIEPVGEGDSKSFVIHLKIFHPGLRKKLLGFMNATCNENMVFVVPDNNGQKFLMGDALRPSTFVGSPDGAGTGKATTDKRGLSFEFIYKCKKLFAYEGTVPLTPAV